MVIVLFGDWETRKRHETERLLCRFMGGFFWMLFWESHTLCMILKSNS
jgi:hypothetical protein